MKFATLLSASALSLTLVAFTAPVSAQGRDTIQIAGSSTVLPFASIVAEEFGNAFSNFKAPVVGSGGTGGGLKQFCGGVGDNTIDIANASRAIKKAELETCNANGVKQVIEVQFGFDGIVFASATGKGTFALEPKHVFSAIAAQVPVDGKLVANPYTKWSQIDKSLPDQDIVLVIPASNHGTREVFEEKVIHPGAVSFAEIKALKGDDQKKAILGFRQDGRVIEIAGDYTETLARLDAQKDAVGVFGLSFYDQNKDKLQVATVSGVTPSLETIAEGKYPVSRPLFFYVKGEHIGKVPGLEEFANYFLSADISGDDSQLVEAGLIPLDDAKRAEVVKSIKARTAAQGS